ncbi:MAG: ferredoxin--NADP+ reductase [Myxococcota bacterium]|jgi:ferredoxin--NADP+ reductase
MTQPLHVAIIGAGPSGFYTAAALLKQQEVSVRIDLFDRLPSPYGLVRSGVAPDHQSIKRIERAFERTASAPGVRFFGNVSLGRDISVADLRAHYHAIIYTTGSEGSVSIDLPGECSPQVRSATEFVFWYNGHPQYQDRSFALHNVRRVAVVGVGNVAVDVARILARNRDELATTDIAPAALEALRTSPIEEIILMGRRGPAQAAFSPKEIEELGELPGVDTIISADDAHIDEASAEWLETAPKTAAMNVALIEDLSVRPLTNSTRRLRILFRASPVEFHLDDDDRLVGMTVVRNRLEPAPGRPRPVPTDETWRENVQLVLTAIGYRGVPIEGVPFDTQRGTIPNVEGRVTETPGGPIRPGEYTAGWIKRGPSGLIGSNRPDAKETVEKLLEDYTEPESRDDITPLLQTRGVRVVTFADWKRLDTEELRRGEVAGRVREKFVTIQGMLDFLG